MPNQLHGENPRTIRTPKTRAEFLAALRETCNVTKACELSGVARRSIYDWRDEDSEFAADWQKALDVAADLLEEEAIRRAKDGTKKPVYQGGELVGHIQEYSDTLLIFLLKGAKPKKYSDLQRHTGADGEGPIQIVSTIPRPPKDE
jgi:terminase small subunit-like protein